MTIALTLDIYNPRKDDSVAIAMHQGSDVTLEVKLVGNPISFTGKTVKFDAQIGSSILKDQSGFVSASDTVSVVVPTQYSGRMKLDIHVTSGSSVVGLPTIYGYVEGGI